MRMVLETLRHHKLYAKASKCQFGRSSVGFLGHVISEHGVAVDPRKIAAVAEWAPPASCTDVQGCLNRESRESRGAKNAELCRIARRAIKSRIVTF